MQVCSEYGGNSHPYFLFEIEIIYKLINLFQHGRSADNHNAVMKVKPLD